MDASRIRQRRIYSGLSLVLIAVLFAAVLIVSNTFLKTARVDLTEEKLFTLSEGSLSVLNQLDEPITLRFYFSERLGREIPSVGLYAQRVRDLLEEYANRSNGKVRLEVYDPEPFSEAEDRAVAYGLQGVPVDQGGELVYFGLAATNSVDEREVIPFFDQSRENLLEYDLTRIIHDLATLEKPVVGLITSLPMAGTPYARRAGTDDSWIVYNQLRQSFEVETISASGDSIPESVKLLVLVHPKNLADSMLYAIDQFVMRGGQLLVFIDPHSEADAAMPQPGMPLGMGDYGSNLEKLLGAWGVEMPADKVAGDLTAARRVQVPTEGQDGTRVAAVDYPLWLALTRDHFDQDDPVVSQLGQVNLASPGFLRKKEGATIEMNPLLVTSDRGAGTVDAALVQGTANPVKALTSFKNTGEPLVLAARLHGTVQSAFPDGPPKADDEGGGETQDRQDAATPADTPTEAAGPEHLAESTAPVNMIVVADVDMLADGLWVRVQDFFGQRIAMPYAHNGAFLINAVENLTGSNELIGLRSRGVYQRPFTKVQAIQREAEQRFRAKEQELLAALRSTEQKLAELQGPSEGAEGVVLTDEQREAIENFRAETVRIRRELRDVQHALRQDVENLSNWIEAINIGLIPLLVAVVAVVLAMIRRGYRRRPRAA